MIQLLVGLIIGAAISSGTWWFILRSSKNREENSKKERDEIMRSVGALMAELDSIINSSKEDTSTKSTHYSSKLETINKILKTNLHFLDIYYVKYIELLLRYYNYRAEKMGLLSATQKPISDIEMETSFSFIDNEGDITTKKEITDEENLQKISPYEKTIPIKREEKVAEEIEKKKDEEREKKESEVDTFNKIEEFTFEKVEELSKNENTSKEIETITEKESVDLLETLTIVEKEEEGVQEEEALEVFEKKEEKEEEKTKLIEREKIVSDMESDTSTILEEKSENLKGAEVYLNLGKSDKRVELNEEEFALETLIDVDASSILSSSPKVSEMKEDNKIVEKEKPSILEPSFTKEDKSSTLLSPSSEENMEVVIASDVKHIQKKSVELPKTEEKSDREKGSVITEENKLTPLYTDETQKSINRVEIKEGVNIKEEEFVLEVKPLSKEMVKEATLSTPPDVNTSTKETTSEFSVEEMITGEDIVNKIDSWNTVHSPSLKKEEKKGKDEENLKKGEKSKTTSSHELEKKVTSHHEKKSIEEQPKEKVKRSDTEGEITGDDVVDKIDSFFGLIKE
ncbi:MAG: hypothetical protein N2053_02035 [Chitinispirillaceae bacterium]|nr:hypothetical protein [Chitinispirillaceae bacterium]